MASGSLAHARCTSASSCSCRERRRAAGGIPPRRNNKWRMDVCGLSKARPISCSDWPVFHRLQMSLFSTVESPNRFPDLIQTINSKSFRWCCIDLSNPPDLSGTGGDFPDSIGPSFDRRELLLAEFCQVLRLGQAGCQLEANFLTSESNPLELAARLPTANDSQSQS